MAPCASVTANEHHHKAPAAVAVEVVAGGISTEQRRGPQIKVARKGSELPMLVPTGVPDDKVVLENVREDSMEEHSPVAGIQRVHIIVVNQTGEEGVKQLKSLRHSRTLLRNPMTSASPWNM